MTWFFFFFPFKVFPFLQAGEQVEVLKPFGDKWTVVKNKDKNIGGVPTDQLGKTKVSLNQQYTLTTSNAFNLFFMIY